jgi:hypothetical protein
MARSLRGHPGLDQSPETYFRNVFLRHEALPVVSGGICGRHTRVVFHRINLEIEPRAD